MLLGALFSATIVRVAAGGLPLRQMSYSSVQEFRGFRRRVTEPHIHEICASV